MREFSNASAAAIAASTSSQKSIKQISDSSFGAHPFIPPQK
jgi:hypothetical protein